MKILLIVFAILFTGCLPPIMTQAKQIVACKEHGGVYLFAHFKSSNLICNDGMQVSQWYLITGPEVVETVQKLKAQNKD